MKEFKFSANSAKNMDGIHRDLITVMYEAIKYSPIDFGVPITGGLRTTEIQQMLFDSGVTKCDGVKFRSNHQDGMAVDVYAYLNGAASWKSEHLSIIAGVVLSTAKRLKADGKISIELTWGGTFGSNEFDGWDKPHYEVKKSS